MQWGKMCRHVENQCKSTRGLTDESDAADQQHDVQQPEGVDCMAHRMTCLRALCSTSLWLHA